MDTPSEKQQSIFAQEILHNKIVKQRINNINASLNSVTSINDMSSVFYAQEHEGTLKYKNKIFWFFIAAATLTLLITIYLMGLTFKHFDSGYGFLWLILPFFAFAFAAKQRKTDAARLALVEKAQKIYLSLKYGFVNFQEQANITHHQNLAEFSAFFKRGNYENKIPLYVSGLIQCEDKEIPYTAINYHYVNRREEVSTDANGKRRIKVVYDHFDSWGMFLGDIQFPAFALTSYRNNYYPYQWTTSSIDFNKKHFITGRSEIELAKLMQPRNILMLENLFSTHGYFEFISSENINSVYWAFEQNIFLRDYDQLNNCDTAAKIGNMLETLRLPMLEKLMTEIKPILEKVVK